ncbi:AAA family ATPase, partial [Corynebacterium sanguinis]|uniref:AAA family ATPase n=1 Tax=Corynebacterium sanguinis TaxID=2594913 RepID=UPI00223B0025
MKIVNIDKMVNCGHFKNFRWPAGLNDFEQVNVIYGANGSGKSSFARAFEKTSEESPWGNRELTLTVEYDSGRQSKISRDGGEDLFEQVFVYSDRYVEKGHSFRRDPTLESVLTIGERTVEDEEKLERIQGELKDAREKRESFLTRKKETEKKIKEIYASVSDAVVSSIAAAGGSWKSKNAFNVPKVKQLFANESSTWVELTDDEKQEKISLINSPKMDAVEVPEFELGDSVLSLGNIEELLSATPISQVLDTLEKHPEASSWVQEGLGLHKESEVCIFCSHSLSDDRRKEISQHFSNEVKELQQSLKAILESMTATKASYSQAFTELPDARILDNNLQVSYESVREKLGQEIHDFQESIDANIAIVRLKLENVLVAVDDRLTELPDVNFSDVLSVISEHNRRVANRDRLIEEAAKAVEGHYLRINYERLQELKKLSEENEKTTTVLEGQVERLVKEEAALLNREGDPLPAAETMTSRVAEILGRSELAFNITSDGEHYSVTRNGQPALDLSTGERSVIMLVYFVEQVASHSKRGKPIVVIDDPVSSMDANAFLGISTYIWSKMINRGLAGQLFLLTHNFELFRQWDIQLDKARKEV